MSEHKSSLPLSCALSGVQPLDPVVVPKTGLIFERRLLKKAMEEGEGRCPITGQNLSEDDIMELKTNPSITPRSSATTGLPGLFGAFQNEWDALMLDCYTLKKNLNDTRQELAHTLYQHDAACRVIARLTKERDTANQQISKLQQHLAVAKAGLSQEASSSDPTGEEVKGDPELLASIFEEAVALSQTLFAGRKKRSHPNLSTLDEIKAFQSEFGQSTGLLGSSPVPLLSLDIHPQDNDRVLVGGAKGSVFLFNSALKAPVEGGVFEHSTSKSCGVSTVAFHPNEDIFFTGGSDGVVKIWKLADPESNWESVYEASATLPLFSSSQSSVSSISVHPGGEMFLASGGDKWVLCHVSGDVLLTGKAEDRISSLAFHPDGLLVAFGCGGSNSVKLLNLSEEMKEVASLDHQARVKDFSFSENGYFFATLCNDGSVNLWDLRKSTIVFSLRASEDPVSTPVSSLDFDFSGKYLAVGVGRGFKILSFKSKNQLEVSKEEADLHAKGKHSNKLKWFRDAGALVSVGSDGLFSMCGKK